MVPLWAVILRPTLTLPEKWVSRVRAYLSANLPGHGSFLSILQAGHSRRVLGLLHGAAQGG